MRLGNEDVVWLVFVVLFLLVPVYLWSFWRKRKALSVLATVEMLGKINISVSFGRQIFKACLLLVGFLFVIIALTQPGWNPKPKKVSRMGRDIVVLLDTSRSMLAEDIRPNRLKRAKIAIADLLEDLNGDRIGLITFAGNSVVKCPLTQDYGFVRMALEEVTTESTSRGGTLIGDAIRKATNEVFDQQTRKYKDVILITDGEDHDSFPVEAAEKAAAEGVLRDTDARVRIDPEYIEVADLQTLQPVACIERPALVAAAVRVGSTRLIDNIMLPEGHQVVNSSLDNLARCG